MIGEREDAEIREIVSPSPPPTPVKEEGNATPSKAQEE